MLEPRNRGLVDPVPVFQDDQHGLALCHALGELKTWRFMVWASRNLTRRSCSPVSTNAMTVAR